MAFFVPLLAAAGGGSALAGGMALAGTALSVAGQISSARTASAVGKANAAAANANAVMMRQEADIARSHGSARAEQQRRRAREILGQQRAALGQAGVGWEGSGADILEQSAVAAELDTMNTGYEAELQARGLLNRATMTEHEGQLRQWEGKQQARAGYIRAGTSLLSGAANYLGRPSAGGVR